MKLNFKTIAFKGIVTVFVLSLFIFTSCIGARATLQIPDYLVVENGKEDVKGKPLHAFIFENNIKAPYQIEQFVAEKYKTGSYQEREIWVTVQQDKYKLIIYDTADFEKYFNSANYSPINEEAQNDRNYSGRKFIAISMVSAYNEDCLAENSLLHNIAITYLRELKNEYIRQ